jgi:hypothetical protein
MGSDTESLEFAMDAKAARSQQLPILGEEVLFGSSPDGGHIRGAPRSGPSG